MKVAIIHYWFITRRGGEKVVESILKKYPQADIYTLFYDREKYGNHLDNHNVYSSILNTKFLRKFYQKIFPLYPLGIKSLKLKKEYDLIISSESGPAKGIKIPNKACHICYIHSPMRYAWSHTELYLQSSSYLLRPILRSLFEKLQKWDKSTIDNVDLYIANSFNVAERVKKYYNRESIVIHPPIEEKLFEKELRNSTNEVYLSFGAITPYKKIDLLIDVFNLNGKELVIIGEGSEKEKLRKKAKDNIRFESFPNWEDVQNVIYKTKALLFPGEEDFGMIPLEIMAYGIPVIAYKKGGALETIIENKLKIEESSGIFFEKQSVESFNDALEYYEKNHLLFNREFIRNQARKFKESNFLHKFENEVKSHIEK
jgi:glycosyltransferase involved in cell wall biosynthesis